MKKIILFILCVCSSIVIFATHSYALLLIDTGVPTNTGGAYWFGIEFDTNNNIKSNQYWAGKITLDENQTISSFQTWLPANPGGSITLTIYGDDGFLPDFDSMYYRDEFEVPSVGNDVLDWYGTSGMSLDLQSGSYWVAFEALATNTYNGYSPEGVLNPLANYAGYWQYSENTWGWNILSGASFSLRVYTGSENTAVPEPSTMLLLGLGLIGLVGVRRKIQS